MNALKALLFAVVVAAGFAAANMPAEAEAGYGARHYYSSWNYRPTYGYHYRTYFYRPVSTYSTYHYHYCLYYPSQPRYVYFYNPIRRVYWGRFDLEGKEGAQYSLLSAEDQKSELSDIPESAFPAPGAMPSIPDSADGTAMLLPTDVPTIAKPAGDIK